MKEIKADTKSTIKDILNNCFVVLVVIGFIVAVCGFFLALTSSVKESGYEEGYLDACKDQYQGKKLKYQLIENKDGTKEWKKISK